MQANPLQNGVEYLEVNQIFFLSLEISSMVKKIDGEEKLKLHIFHCSLKNLLRVHFHDTTTNISLCSGGFVHAGSNVLVVERCYNKR